MPKANVLVTGGAGFIGSHLVDYLLERGYRVTVLDNLTPQVHKDAPKDEDGWPIYLNRDCRRLYGDVLNENDVRFALAGQDYLIHLAGSVGVGQSMTNILDYTRNNELGGAVILDVLNRTPHKIQKMAVASSISIYGDGAYRKASTGEVVHPQQRSARQLAARQWEMQDSEGEILQPMPTPESKQLFPRSIYAVNKLVHELDFLIMGEAWKIPTAAMRMFNVFGTRQALSNPYTGVVAIFASQLMNGHQPSVFEDGGQLRNFVDVRDVVRAYGDFLESDIQTSEVFNVGSDEVIRIRDLARLVSNLMGCEVEPSITQTYRVGDIRHCYPDLLKIKHMLGWQAEISLAEGLPEVVQWAVEQVAIDYTPESLGALRAQGLLT